MSLRSGESTRTPNIANNNIFKELRFHNHFHPPSPPPPPLLTVYEHENKFKNLESHIRSIDQ